MLGVLLSRLKERVNMKRDEMEERRRRSMAGDPPDKAMVGWGATFVAVVIGAAIVGNIWSLRRRLQNFHVHNSQGNSARSGANSRQNTSSQQQVRSQRQGRSSFYEADDSESYARRLWAEHVREIERLRRIQQESSDRERMRTKRNYDSWQERHGDKWDWRWQGTRWEWQGESERVWNEESADGWRRRSEQEKKKTSRNYAEPSVGGASNRQHYAVLGLDPSRPRPYTEAEIKAAFRAKALEFHPDTNKTNKAEAEKKFHKVMEAYNALKGSK